MYLMVLNETLAKNEDPRNGTVLYNNAKYKTFDGMLFGQNFSKLV